LQPSSAAECPKKRSKKLPGDLSGGVCPLEPGREKDAKKLWPQPVEDQYWCEKREGESGVVQTLRGVNEDR